MKVIFMGTPDFAVPSLKILHENGYEIVGVITATDKYGGRGGKKLIESPVKQYAAANGIRVLQPKNLKAPEFVDTLRSLDADIQVVVAFRMLPEVVWNMPPLGTMNLHGSLLPKYRGAAPIHWAVINGEKETGATTFFLKHEIDTGDMLFQTKIPIGDEDTTGDVHDKMMLAGAELVLKSLQAVESEDYVLIEQDNSLVSKAPKIYTETCEINFNQSTESVYNFIRGLCPFPVAWTTLDDLKLKVYASARDMEEHNLSPGTWQSDGKRFLKVATTDGFICFKNVKLQGRKRMDVKSFLNGYKLGFLQ